MIKKKRIKKRNGCLHFKRHSIQALGTTFFGEDWIVVDLNTKEEYKLTDEKQLEWPKDKNEGLYVQYEVIENFGMDPYDNQVPGIDYYDAAKILKYYNKKETRNIKLIKIIS